jgi:hypothetical protein
VDVNIMIIYLYPKQLQGRSGRFLVQVEAKGPEPTPKQVATESANEGERNTA